MLGPKETSVKRPNDPWLYGIYSVAGETDIKQLSPQKII